MRRLAKEEPGAPQGAPKENALCVWGEAAQQERAARQKMGGVGGIFPTGQSGALPLGKQAGREGSNKRGGCSHEHGALQRGFGQLPRSSCHSPLSKPCSPQEDSSPLVASSSSSGDFNDTCNRLFLGNVWL